MISENQRLFVLTTRSTSYVCMVNGTGQLEHLYYGHRIKLESGDISALRDKHHARQGDGLSYNEAHQNLQLENLPMEYSTEGKGDYRPPMVAVSHDGGYNTLDFVYESHTITQGKPRVDGIGAQSYGTMQNCSTLAITLKEVKLPLTLTLRYTTFDDSDVIVRSASLTNKMDTHLYVSKLDSLQLDLVDDDWDLLSFNGAWARERHLERSHVSQGTHVIESRSGVSSAGHNPLVFLARPTTTEESGEVYGCNLVYSGNHKEEIDVSPYGKVRLLTGINSSTLRWKLMPGETFSSPEAVLTYSDQGLGGASARFQQFVNEHIVRGLWKWRERPVLLNSWEAFYFKYDEDKLLSLARHAASLGVELFVIDDGWFGSRVDDRSSLGDWTVNPGKFPSGIAEFSRRIHNLGMLLGIWVEPEMVSEESQLYKAHPDWAIEMPGRDPAMGRHQLILDLTRKDVRDYLFDSIGKVLTDGDVNYVKWDMNRTFSDLYTINHDVRHMGEFSHRYVLGLYELLDRFTRKFPNILFEGCASGGNRFDLGMLCYTSQIWCSDDTDARERIAIQSGTSYGYPLSTIGSHVSAVPNHQTMRITNLESRFNVAAFGSLGYELDLASLPLEQRNLIREQIAFYKRFRSVFQFGTFYRNKTGNQSQWSVVSQDRKTILTLFWQDRQVPNGPCDVLRVPQADENAMYDVFPRAQGMTLGDLGGRLASEISPLKLDAKTIVPTEVEHYTVSGGLLKWAGIRLNQQYFGKDWDEQTRVMGDCGSRIYLIKKR